MRPNGKQAPELPEVIEGRIGLLRQELGELVAELDRRRHEATDLRLQVKRHPVIAGVAALTVAVAIGSVIGLAVRNARRRERPVEKARRARRAMQRLMSDPEHLAREPTIPEKILVAAGTAAASLLVRRFIERAVPARS